MPYYCILCPLLSTHNGTSSITCRKSTLLVALCGITILHLYAKTKCTLKCILKCMQISLAICGNSFLCMYGYLDRIRADLHGANFSCCASALERSSDVEMKVVVYASCDECHNRRSCVAEPLKRLTERSVGRVSIGLGCYIDVRELVAK